MRAYFFKKVINYLNRNFEHFTTNDSTIWVVKGKVIANLDKDSFEIMFEILKDAVL